MGWIHNANGTVTDERTGLVFSTETMGNALGYGQTPAAVAVPQPPRQYVNSDGSIGMDYRARDSRGNLITNQTNSSQFWMDAGYSGPEPTMDDKRAYSDANYAYENAQRIIEQRAREHGISNINPSLRPLADPVNIMSPLIPPSISDIYAGLTTDPLKWLTENWVIVAVVAGIVIILGRR